MEMRPDRAAFDRVRDQIGYCGLWCGSCAVGNGCIGELGAGLRELLIAYDVSDFATVGTGWEPFLEALGSLKRAVACPGCREGGGRDTCDIKSCAVRHGLESCTECASFGGCEHSAILEHMRSGAARVGLSVLQQQESRIEALPEWTRAQAARWPCCVLLSKGNAK